MLADRRADYARMYAEGGNPAAAADLQRQALELAPRWAAGWHELGSYLEKAGDPAGAAEAWRQVLVLCETDIFGAGLKLAASGQAQAPAAPPSEYVAQLFDDYAERFDAALIERLGYTVPERLSETIAAVSGAGHQFARAIDLGCGTGLFGERIRRSASWLEGYDLSEGMLAKAATKGIYDHLAQADIRFGIDAPATSATEKAGLVVAADVFAYFGDLAPVLDCAVGLLAESGLIAFSVEAGLEDCDWLLQPSLRYCHGEAYLRRLLAARNVEIVSLDRAPLRRDGERMIEGLLVVGRKAAVTQAPIVDGFPAGDPLSMLSHCDPAEPTH